MHIYIYTYIYIYIYSRASQFVWNHNIQANDRPPLSWYPSCLLSHCSPLGKLGSYPWNLPVPDQQVMVSGSDLTKCQCTHDDVSKWNYFPRYWPIHRSPVNSPHKGQWRGALIFSLICAWINGWVNNRKAGALRHYRAHYDVTVMQTQYSPYQHAAVAWPVIQNRQGDVQINNTHITVTT